MTDDRLYCDILVPPVIQLDTAPPELFKKPMVAAFVEPYRAAAAKMQLVAPGDADNEAAKAKSAAVLMGCVFAPTLRGMPPAKLVPGLCACRQPNPQCVVCGMGFRQRIAANQPGVGSNDLPDDRLISRVKPSSGSKCPN